VIDLARAIAATMTGIARRSRARPGVVVPVAGVGRGVDVSMMATGVMSIRVGEQYGVYSCGRTVCVASSERIDLNVDDDEVTITSIRHVSAPDDGAEAATGARDAVVRGDDGSANRPRRHA
jgi:hypothetical protein